MIAKKRLMPVLAAVLMIFAMMSMIAGTVYGTETGGAPGISTGTSVLETGCNTNDAPTVYYGGKAWQVIGYNGGGAVNETGAATLLAAGILDQSWFDDSKPYSNYYSDSTLEGAVNGILNGFAPEEQGAIKTRTLVHGTFDRKNTDCVAGDADITNVALWPLSTKEACAVNKDLRIAASGWWLRSPGGTDDFVALVLDSGIVGDVGVNASAQYGVRPAFYLNLESVLFTSAAEGGKSSGSVGAGALSAISDNTTGEWKLTLKDADRSNFTAAAGSGAELEAPRGYTGWSIPITYAGAKTGQNEYVSVILCDRNGIAKYYGNIANNSASSGTEAQVVNIPEGLISGDYTMYVFSEQINGEQMSDYASEFKAINLKVIGQPCTVTFNANGGTWEDGTTADKEVTVTQDEAATAPEAPTREGYVFDGWDTDFSNVTTNLTVKAKWIKTYTVTVNNGDGSHDYLEGDSVTITASNLAGKKFKEWGGDVDLVTFTEGNKTTSTAKFTMPSKALTFTATYEDVLAVSPGTEAMNYNVNKSNAQTLWYADTTWRVIGYNGDEAASKTGAATLLAAGNLGQSAFDDDLNGDNYYSGSTLEGAVNGILNGFAPEEQGAIKMRTLEHGEFAGVNTDCIAGDADLTDVALWPLSTKEAFEVAGDLRKADPDHPGWKSSIWWLRSPAEWGNYAGLVDNVGEVKINYSSHLEYAVFNAFGVRPAFYLNLGSVLFTSAAEGGKSSDPEGPDALKAQSDQINSSSEWKVTVKDAAHAGFAVSNVSPAENGVTVEYTGAATGTNEYISAIITDKSIKEESAAIKYYGRIATASAAGSVTINTEGKLGENDHLYVFNEQCNGDKKTDYASELKSGTITEKIAAPTGKTRIYNGKSQTGVAAGAHYTLTGTTKATKAGTYTAKATLNADVDHNYAWSDGTTAAKTIKWKINKAANTLKIKAKTATVKGSTKGRKGKLKKTKTLGVTKVIKFTSKGQGAKTYVKKSGNKKITIAKKTGKVTVKKGLKKGTYKVKVKVKAAGDANYNPSAWKVVTFKIIVK